MRRVVFIGFFLFVSSLAACASGSASGGTADAALSCTGPGTCPEGFDCVEGHCVRLDAGGQDVLTEPDLVADPTALDFGSPPVGEPVTRTLTLTNRGGATLALYAIEVQGDEGLEEFEVSPGGQLDRTLAPGETLDVTVVYTSLDEIAEEANLVVTSNDPDEPELAIPLQVGLTGNRALGTCVLRSDEYFQDCVQDPEVIDYGDLAYDATALARITVYNAGTGNTPLVVDDISVTNDTGNGDLFTVRVFRLVRDDQAPGGWQVEDASGFPDVPASLPPDDGQGVPEALLVEVEFHALVDGQPVPAEHLVIRSADRDDPEHAIAFVGTVGCPEGRYDLDGEPGCEYECTVTNGGVEECDGQDNDCDGETDEGVSPGLCLICDVTGQPAAAADDKACGIIDCSGWFAKQGNAGPTDTEQCFAHQDMDDNRCEGPEDCKDSNTEDCQGQPLESAPVLECGLCQHMEGCVGATPGTCVNYPAGTKTQLCGQCDGNGGEQAAADDNDCGVIDCSGWFTKQGVPGPTTSEECYSHENMSSNRCEGLGDCKDPNTSDCDSQPLEAGPVLTCGVCQYMQGCVGATPGTCLKYPAGTSVGLCAECDGNGSETMPADDPSCGTVDCGGWYTKTGTRGPTATEYCYGHQDITSNRCEGLGDCKDSNSSDCDGQPLDANPILTCGVCQYMTGCSGTTMPQCVNYPPDTPTSGTCGTGVCERPFVCDGAGNNGCTPGSPTGDDTDCNGLDDDCDGATDNHYVPHTCGLGICQRQSTCVNGQESCVPGTPQPTDDPDDAFQDTNCDGIDGDEAQAIFVATNGSDGNPGTKDRPKRTIQAAIDAAASQGKDVYVSEGTYSESLTLKSGVSIYGGYSRQNGWARSDAYHVVIMGGTTAVFCNGQSNIVLDHLRVYAANATAAGSSSYAVRLVSCQNVTIRKSLLQADDGGPGAAGSNGSAGAAGSPGGDGAPGCEDSSGWCDTCNRPPGGTGGHGCGGNNGGTGGTAGHGGGNGGTGGSGIGPGGAGGAGGSCDRDWNGSCGIGCWNGSPGSPGGNGANGTDGAGGQAFNTASTSFYVASNGSSGTNGQAGGGGGGGGGGHGGDDDCDSYGSAGGGGGGGGCGGTAGSGGGGGGGSFGLWASSSSNVRVLDCSIVTGDGGSGGSGGSGGAGGAGGPAGSGGGYGGNGEQDDGGCGADGGPGGRGGRGGHGGGGGGGPSVGIVFRLCSSCSQSGNAFTLGSAGSGGWSAGHSGASGLRTNVYTF